MYIHYSPSSYTSLIIWYNYTKLIIYNCSSYFGELRISTSVYFCNALEPKEPKPPRQQSTSLNWYTKTSKCLNNSKLTFLKASLAKAKEKAIFLSQLPICKVQSLSHLHTSLSSWVSLIFSSLRYHGPIP